MVITIQFSTLIGKRRIGQAMLSLKYYGYSIMTRMFLDCVLSHQGIC